MAVVFILPVQQKLGNMVVGEVIHDMDVAHGRHEPCDGVSRAADIREVFADDLRAEADDLNVFDSALEEDFAQALEELRIALPVGDEIERVNAVVGVHVADVGPAARRDIRIPRDCAPRVRWLSANSDIFCRADAATVSGRPPSPRVRGGRRGFCSECNRFFSA